MKNPITPEGAASAQNPLPPVPTTKILFSPSLSRNTSRMRFDPAEGLLSGYLAITDFAVEMVHSPVL